MPCVMVIGVPGVLLCLSIWYAGWEPEGDSSKPGGPIDLIYVWKKPLIALSHPLVGVNGATGVDFSTVDGVGRHIFLFSLDPPVAILETLFAELGGHTILYFWMCDVSLLTLG